MKAAIKELNNIENYDEFIDYLYSNANSPYLNTWVMKFKRTQRDVKDKFCEVASQYATSVKLNEYPDEYKVTIEIPRIRITWEGHKTTAPRKKYQEDDLVGALSKNFRKML